MSRKKQERHGDSTRKHIARTYTIWINIKARCTNKNAINFHNYGGRGIKICKSWMKYLNFKEWALMNGYSDNLSIDRIDNNKGYYPSNCRFVTPKQNANNCRSNHIVEFDGKRLTLTQWQERTGIHHATLRHRIKKLGWSIEKSLTTPTIIAKRNHNAKQR